MDKLNLNLLLNRKDCEDTFIKSLNYFEENKEKLLTKRGIYVYGAPGCGKTYFVRNILKKLNWYYLKNKFFDLIKIKHDDGEIKEFKTDYVLGFFGLIMQLGPILDWGLNISKKTIEVNTENFETNIDGIFAIGDIFKDFLSLIE